MLRFLAWHYLFNGIQFEFNLSNFEVNPDIWNCGKKHKWTPNTWWFVDHQPRRVIRSGWCKHVQQSIRIRVLITWLRWKIPLFQASKWKRCWIFVPYPTIQNPLIQLLPNSSKQLCFVLSVSPWIAPHFRTRTDRLQKSGASLQIPHPWACQTCLGVYPQKMAFKANCRFRPIAIRNCVEADWSIHLWPTQSLATECLSMYIDYQKIYQVNPKHYHYDNLNNKVVSWKISTNSPVWVQAPLKMLIMANFGNATHTHTNTYAYMHDHACIHYSTLH